MKDIVTTEEARKGFYPTPEKLAEKLLDGIDWDYIHDVLEPSAGKGNLVKAVAKRFEARVRRRYNAQKVHVDCVEIDPYLRAILNYEFGGEKREELLKRSRQIDDGRKYNYETHRYEYPSPELQEEYGILEEEKGLLDSVACHVVYNDFLCRWGRSSSESHRAPAEGRWPDPLPAQCRDPSESIHQPS